MNPTAPKLTPAQERLHALYRATRPIKAEAEFHEAMLQHAQEIHKALIPVAVVPAGAPIPGPGNPDGPATAAP
jgi:hypothetical protein